MKKSRFSEQQIAFILRQAEEGTTVEEVCRKAGISEATYYNWRKKYGGLMPSEMKRLKQLEEENQRLMKLVRMPMHTRSANDSCAAALSWPTHKPSD
jgi:putative transposase